MSKDLPETKKCNCGVVFERNAKATDFRWKKTLNCPTCQEKRKRKPHPVNIIHHVIHPVLDAFLYGRPS